MFIGTAWAIVPPIVAIVLALITKEVYSSLFAGCLLAAVFVSVSLLPAGLGFWPSVGNVAWGSFERLFASMAENMDLNILIFDVLLGMIIVLLAKSGASRAYGAWASKRIKSKRGAMLSTSALGILIFVDDYFNCLTVGNIMRPITDKYKVSRAKLAYIIDATAAPVCILAPVSSWAAAVSSYIPEGYDINGFQMFCAAIPFNFYAILTLIMVFFTSFFLIDFGKMRRHELNAAKGDLFTSGGEEFKDMEQSEQEGSSRGRVSDLLIPIIVLIVTAVFAMILTGYHNGAENLIDAFANCSASLALVFATFMTVIVMAIMYIPRKVVSAREFINCLVEGFKVMIPAITVLIFAWTLKGLVDQLSIGTFVQGIFSNSTAVSIFLPVAIFLVACLLGFSTGTSWGTMGILIPIIVPMCASMPEVMTICISATMAGAVCGDHISPISDTTIMSSAGAQCNHINHVETQMQYAVPVIAVSAVSFIIAGAVKHWYIALPISIVIMLAVIMVLYKISNGKKAKDAA